MTQLQGDNVGSGGGAGAQPADVLSEILFVQREYVRDADPGRMFEVLLDTVLRVTGSDEGFIGEVDWDRSTPTLLTRGVRRPHTGATHPDMALLVGQRRHSALGMHTPVEYERIHTDNQPLALRNQAT